ncbi:hypothetical protein F4823DRAFT_586096 [Ustulina deusta]|nr:hypothetical protein F4823DRAFT_586096 [Ustulina deusta]
MTTPSPTSSPTLRPDWIPTSSGCLRTSDFWIWEFNGATTDARTVIGGPSQTTDCFASTWSPSVIYAGSGCPSQYTLACQDSNNGAVTCCPTVHDFTCQPETSGATDHGPWFRCESMYASGGVITVTRTDFQANNRALETRTAHTYEHLFALALIYTTPASSSPSATTSLPTSSSDPSTTDTPSKNTSSGLTAGAAAGIGVGVAAGIIILALLGWFMYRRRRAARLSNETTQYPTPLTPMTPGAYTYTTEASRSPSQYLTPPLASSPPKELPAEGAPVYELQGNETWQHKR